MIYPGMMSLLFLSACEKSLVDANFLQPVGEKTAEPAASGPAAPISAVVSTSGNLSILSAPDSRGSPMIGPKGRVLLKLAVSGQASDGTPYSSFTANDKNHFIWKCVFKQNIRGQVTTVTQEQCAVGINANIDLTSVVQRDRRHISTLVDAHITVTYNSQQIAVFDREIFMNPKNSKLVSCFNPSVQQDADAAKALAAKRYADFADNILHAPQGFSAAEVASSGPLSRIRFADNTSVPALSTIRDIVPSGKYLVILRKYAKASEPTACLTRGVKTSWGQYGSALVFDRLGRIVLINDSGTTLTSLNTQLTGQINAVAQTIKKSLPEGSANYSDLGNTEVTAWLNSGRAKHLVSGLDPVKVGALVQ